MSSTQTGSTGRALGLTSSAKGLAARLRAPAHADEPIFAISWLKKIKREPPNS